MATWEAAVGSSHPIQLSAASASNLFEYTGSGPHGRWDPLGLAWVGRRPLTTAGKVVAFLAGRSADAFHEQIFFDDTKTNIGWTIKSPGCEGEGEYIVETDSEKIAKYTETLTGLDDDLMRTAVENVKANWGEEYDCTTHNCQDFVSSVLAEYNKLLQQRQKEGAKPKPSPASQQRGDNGDSPFVDTHPFSEIADLIPDPAPPAEGPIVEPPCYPVWPKPKDPWSEQPVLGSQADFARPPVSHAARW